MTAGNIGAWQKKAGDKLSPGEVLVEIETDKAQMDFEFQEEGVLAKILKEQGEKDIAVGSVRITFSLNAKTMLTEILANRCNGRGGRRHCSIRELHN